MKLQSVIIFLLLFCLPAFALHGQPTMHVVIFSATDDLYIGDGNRKSLELLDKELERIKREAKGAIVVSEEYFTGDRCTVEEFNACTKKLKSAVGLDDIVLFYFMGHGFMVESDEVDTPNLLFANTDGPMSDDFIQNNHLNLSEVHDKMKSTGARLTITVGEACNSHVEKIKDSRLVDSQGKINTSSPGLIKPKRYEELLTKPSGDVMIYSSIKGQPSYVSDIYGGVFTQAFIKALHRTISSSNTAFWQNLCTLVSQNTYNVCQEAGIIDKQMPDEIIKLDDDWLGWISPEDTEEPKVIIDEIVGKFKGSKELKKAVRRMLKDKNASKDVYDLLHRPDIAEENTKYQPLSHYIIKGKMGEEHDVESKILLYYSIANSLYKPKDGKTRMSKIDYDVVKMMNKMAERKKDRSEFARAIIEAGSVYKWLVQSQEDLVERMYESKGEKEKEVKDLYDFIAEIDLQILEEEKAINVIDKEIADWETKIAANQDTIKGLNTFKNARVTASVHDIKGVTEDDITQISDYIDCLQMSNTPEDCEASSPAILLTGHATINFASDSITNEGIIINDFRNYPVGKSCTKNIISTTLGVTSAMMDALNRVPRQSKYMDKIKISGVIKGFADYRGAGKLLNIYHMAEEYISTTYKNKFDETRDITFLEGRSTRITNEELAFLRAYCAYQIIKDKISETTGGMLDVESEVVFDVKFEAIEQDKDKNSNTDEYRGVDIQLGVDNLYNWVEDSINEKKLENQNLVGRIKELEVTKEGHEYKKKGLEKKRKEVLSTIDKKQKEIFEIQKVINENGLNGSNTESEMENINVKELTD